MPSVIGDRKFCPKCEEDKRVAAFNRDSSRPDGLNHWCRTCGRAQYKEYYASEAGYTVNRKANRCYKQSDRGKAATQRYQRSNEGKATYSKASAKRRALKVGAISDMTPENWKILEARHPVCAYCGHTFEAEGPFKRQLEHVVPLSRGGQHTLDNVVFACSRCNTQKRARLPEEWINRWYEQDGMGGTRATATVSPPTLMSLGQ